MNSQGDVLSFLDLLDLDEEVVDSRLKSIMVRSSFSNKHLTNALQLLKYKNLINIQEENDCCNRDEFDFVAKLIKEMNVDIIDNICKVTAAVLQLNNTSLASYSEHLLLQILGNFDLSMLSSKNMETESNTLHYLKICDSVLDVAISRKERLSLLFLETPLEEILCSADEILKVHFTTSTVPKIVECVNGYDILSRIWIHLEKLKGENRSTALKVLSSLSEYYLPITLDGKNAKFESTIVFNRNFWELLLYGLMSEDAMLRKMAVYLAKRALDYVVSLKTNINVKLDDTTSFTWEFNNQDQYKNQWDNFFILIDSLEEKQSNIVLPSLQLFDNLALINHRWLNCAYKLGLTHDNAQVRLKCVEHRIKSNINNISEAVLLLGALNDFNFYDNKEDCEGLKEKLSQFLNNEDNLLYVLEAIPQAHLSPVPFYHLTDVIINLDISIEANKHLNISQTFVAILKTSCNSVVIRETIHYNVAHFVGKSCKNMHWRDLANIYNHFQIETGTDKNALVTLIQNFKLDNNDSLEFYKFISESHLNINFGILYLNYNKKDMDMFLDALHEKGKAIAEVINRQYADKTECFKDAVYVMNFLKKCNENIRQLLPDANKAILQYTLTVLSNDVYLSIEEAKLLFSNIHYKNENNLKDVVLQLYKTAVMFIQDSETDLGKMLQSILTIECLTNNLDFVQNFSNELVNLKKLLQMETVFEKKAVANKQSLGRIRNVFYETHSKLVYVYLSSMIKSENLHESEKQAENVILFKILNIKNMTAKSTDWKEIVDYIEKVIDCGGYGCLEWILRTANQTFHYMYEKMNICQFINRIWKEIDELKSSNHYLPCMKEFVELITQKTLIMEPEYNNIITSYCNKIIEYGFINNSPLHLLIHDENLTKFILEQDGMKKLNEYGHLVYVLSEILLFCPVPIKCQRITDNLIVEIMKQSRGKGYTTSSHHFDFEIQYQAIKILAKITDHDVLHTLTIILRNKIDSIFKSRFRYHGNSQVHRTLQCALQHLLVLRFLKLQPDGAEFNWCIDLLGRMPHQPSVRICLEWYIALHLYRNKIEINDQLFKTLQSKKVPLNSQMIISYWLIQRKLSMDYEENEFHTVMNMLLSHTMGQLFNIRLVAQYLALKLYEKIPNTIAKDKYDTIVDVIKKTLEENANDKNYVRLREDYFVNDFKIIGNLTPFFIYHTLSRFCDVGNNEDVRISTVLKIMDEVNEVIDESMDPEFQPEWVTEHIWDEVFIKIESNRRVSKKAQEELENVGTIQKKYIPWKNMSDINVYNVEKKRENISDLIVVASLIDKLPNLGGMARTSEVFGVHTYVIDSLRHLQDRQFQGLSVSAERWVNIEEVRPGAPLKAYLTQKKAEGYTVVAAEQTSSSIKLQNFKFPKKTLLLLGHEKEGIPCELLPMMDRCVEIPQQGLVRSLNVHVTAAIFVWEYARQNVL